MVQRSLPPVALLVAMLVLAGLAAAQASVDGRNDALGDAAPQAQTQRDINALYNLIFPIAIVIGILVEALLLYAIIRYRGQGGKVQDSGEHERGHHKLEIAWTIPPAAILLMVGLLSAQTLGAIEEGPPRDFTVTVTAAQFSWTFTYPDGTKDSILQVEANKVVDLNVTATDVIHSFSVPSLGVKIDAIPGRINHYWLKAEQAGDYQVQCMEYCGSGHWNMRTGVKAVAPGSTRNGWVPPAAAGACAADVPQSNVTFLESGGSPWSADPRTLSIRAGPHCFNVLNPAGQTPHNMAILQGTNGAKVATMEPKLVQGGEKDILNADLAAGTYTYYCAVPGHRQLGMEGTITVA